MFSISNETKNVSNIDYFNLVQIDINEKMRAVLIDWLLEVHSKYKMLHQTLAMAVNIVDRF